MALCGAETWTVESKSEIPGKFSNVVEKNDRSREKIRRVKEERNNVQTIKRRKID
jgi:hypothetical protein